jgi:hypothetical protein
VGGEHARRVGRAVRRRFAVLDRSVGQSERQTMEAEGACLCVLWDASARGYGGFSEELLL